MKLHDVPPQDRQITLTHDDIRVLVAMLGLTVVRGAKGRPAIKFGTIASEMYDKLRPLVDDTLTVNLDDGVILFVEEEE